MLQIESVYKQYSTKVLLEGATAHLRPGSRVGLVGPMGAGRTTPFRWFLVRTRRTKARSVSVLVFASAIFRRNSKPLQAKRCWMQPTAISTRNTKPNGYSWGWGFQRSTLAERWKNCPAAIGCVSPWRISY